MKLIERYKASAALSEYEIAGITALAQENSEKSLRVPLDNVLQARAQVMRKERPRGNLVRPVFIIGMPRSGASFLHNALARIEGIRVPEIWEARYQAPPRHQNPTDDVRRIRTAREAATKAIPISIASMLVGGRSPLCAASDSEIMMPTFWSATWGTMFRWQAYFQKWKDQDMRPALRYHRSVVEEWAYYRPNDRFVFRDNWHQFHMDDLREVYPDATIIRMVRDKSVCLKKFSTTMRAINPNFGSMDEIAKIWEDDCDDSLSADITVSCEELSSWPVQIVASVCSGLGIEINSRSEAALEEWLHSTFRPRSPSCP